MNEQEQRDFEEERAKHGNMRHWHLVLKQDTDELYLLFTAGDDNYVIGVVGPLLLRGEAVAGAEELETVLSLHGSTMDISTETISWGKAQPWKTLYRRQVGDDIR